MKKTLLYLMVLALTGSSSKAQLIKNWEKSAGASYSWFATSAAQINSCAYNPVTNKLYVANRQVGVNIINPETGAAEGVLNISGITLAGSLAFHKIRVTSTGEIFAASLKSGTSNGVINIYR